MNSVSKLWDPIIAAHGGKADADDKKPAEEVAAESADAIGDRVRKEEAERAADIAAACALADCPERAAGFIADASKGLSDVLAILVRERSRPKGLASFHQRPKG